jgi:WD40 repeat protein
MPSLPTIPDHVLLRLIGQGAYGEVWLARNVMGTLRAVKVIWRRQFESARPFDREFTGIQRYEPVSRSSGGLVHVLHVGRNDADGYFYYVMELADNAMAESEIPNRATASSNPADVLLPSAPGGYQTMVPFGSVIDSLGYAPRTLRADLKRLGHLETADSLRLAIDVASGLSQLHRQGLVHRDVKPGNIIYIGGRAKLADIGLVTAEGEGRTFVGTEGYIPPEGPGSPKADLYALGIVLYEASTGFPPERLPDIPSHWLTGLAGEDALELHEIILKASEGQRERRYAGVEALQADLALLQSGQSIRRARALERRYARLRWFGFVGTILLGFAVVTTVLANYRARLAAENRGKEIALRESAQQSQARAESAEREARRELQSALYEQARALVLSKALGHRTRALEAIRGAAGATNAVELRRVALAALNQPDLSLEGELALPADLTLAQVDQKFDRIALSWENSPVTVCSLPDLRTLVTLPASTTNDATVARWSADGRFLAVKRQDSLVDRADLEIWDVGRAQLLFSLQRNLAGDCFCFDPRFPRLMTGCADGSVVVWNLEPAQELHPFQLAGRVYALALSPDGRRVAAAYRRGRQNLLAFHDAATGELLSAVTCPEMIMTIAWHPSGRWVSVAGHDRADWNRGVRLFDVETGAETLLGRHRVKTSDVKFSPDGDYLMSCGWDRELRCWDLRSRQCAFTVADAGNFLDWDAEGTHCAMAFMTGKFKWYAFERPACVELIGNRGEQLRPGAFSSNDRLLALSDDRNLCLWDLANPSPAALLAPQDFWQPFFSSTGEQLFAVRGASGAAQLRGWSLQGISGTSNCPDPAPIKLQMPPRLNWAVLSGNELVLTSDRGVQFLARTNLDSGEFRTKSIPSGQGKVSPQGNWLAVTYSFSTNVAIYRLPMVEPVTTLETGGFVDSVWFAPKDDELTVMNRGGIEWWDTATWRRKRREAGTPVSGSYVLYAPDGRSFWRVTNFRDAGLYERDSLQPIVALPPNVLPLAWSSDGRHLAVGVEDQRVQLWDLMDLRSRLRELGLDW